MGKGVWSFDMASDCVFSFDHPFDGTRWVRSKDVDSISFDTPSVASVAGIRAPQNRKSQQGRRSNGVDKSDYPPDAVYVQAASDWTEVVSVVLRSI
jgi:hypothetical protein